jgi:CDP-diacylglycerol pyrophosphatase
MRNWFIISLIAGAIAIGATLSATAAPRFSKGTSTSGAVVYQDDQDPNQFFYLPIATQALLGDRLKNFKACLSG